MSDLSTLLALPYLMPAQAQKHVTHNEALRMLDVLVQLAVLDRNLTSPPTVPIVGDRHIVASGATGDWAGQDGLIAVFVEGGWTFFTPRAGWRAEILSEDLSVTWDGSQWRAPLRLPQLGIDTDADPVNRLAVAATASLFSHAGSGGHQVKLNKATTADTASLLFQNGWSGRAEIGLTGNDGLSLRVSADGSSWITALAFAPLTGTASGHALTQTATDTVPGRLLKVGDYGLGATSGLSTPGDDANQAVVPGFNYRFSTSGMNTPVGNPYGGVLNVCRGTGGARILQEFTASTGTRRWLRASTDNGATWSAWRECYTQSSLLGTVSQSAGVPTGAVIERGNNANGEYVRLADGAQICTRVMSASAAAATTWTFPAAFAAGPVIGGIVVATQLSGLCLDTAPTTAAVTFSARDKSDARRADTVHLTATGRWF